MFVTQGRCSVSEATKITLSIVQQVHAAASQVAPQDSLSCSMTTGNLVIQVSGMNSEETTVKCLTASTLSIELKFLVISSAVTQGVASSAVKPLAHHPTKCANCH